MPIHRHQAPCRGLDDFLRGSCDAAFLTAGEERELIGAYRDGDASALAPLVASNVRFVASVARAVTSSRRVVIPLEDACQAGTLGLIEAVGRFDPGRNLRLQTYAKSAIRRHILAENVRYLAVNVPADLVYRGRSYPSPACLAMARVAMRCRNASEAVERPGRVALSWESLFGAGHADDPSETCEREERLESLRVRLAALPERESRVLRLRFGFDDNPMTLREIGTAMGVSNEWVRQLEARALGRLEKRIADAQHA